MRCVCLLLLGIVLAGCGGGGVDTGGSPVRTVRIDWLGYESFLLTSSLGTKVLTNPYHDGIGGRSFPKKLRPDVLLVSTEEAHSNNVDALDNTPSVFRGAVGAGSNTAYGLRIRGTPTFANPEKEDAADMNLVFTWTLDGLRFCFLGNIESALNSSQVLQVGPVDVLFLPVDAPSSLTDTERALLIAQLRPRLIIPMGPAGAVGNWSGGGTHLYRLPGSSVILSRPTLPAEQTALVFSTP